MIKHYIITAFNLPKAERLDKNGNPTLTPEYMKERFRLFEQFCFPSVYGQTNHNFTWLILFSDRTDRKYHKKIKQYCDIMPNLVPLFLKDETAFRWRDYITEYIRADTDAEYCITSRIDNDDSYNITYVERVQNAVREGKLKRAFLSFPFGLRYSTSYKIAFYSKPIIYNHFISLILPMDRDFKIVYFCDHTLLSETGIPVIEAEIDQMMWLEVIHNTNAINNVNPEDLFHPVFNRKSLWEFHIDILPRHYRIYQYLVLHYIKIYFKIFAKIIRTKYQAIKKGR
ncbi:MAG TPA: glycosyltransferase [Mobilitalea sp.]|nr:glycosyltransferase [Mobilitalea sp.]